MARVTTVKKAQKDILTYSGEEKLKKNEPLLDEDYQVRKGEQYYWWKFRFGGKHISKTYPKQSQLTQSEFLGNVYDLQDEMGNATAANQEDLESLRDDWCERIREMGSECEDRRSNMPDHLQDSGSGEILQNRVDECENWASELENVDCEVDEDSIRESVINENPTDDETLREEAIENLTTDESKPTEDEIIAEIESLRSEKDRENEESAQNEIQEKVEEILSELQNCNYNGE